MAALAAHSLGALALLVGSAALVAVASATPAGRVAADRELGMFVNLVLNGLALQLAQGDEPPPAELVLRLLRGRRRRRRYERRSSSRYARA